MVWTPLIISVEVVWHVMPSISHARGPVKAGLREDLGDEDGTAEARWTQRFGLDERTPPPAFPLDKSSPPFHCHARDDTQVLGLRTAWYRGVPAMDDQDGLRPSSAAATYAALRARETTAARRHPRIPAPEDGRPPLSPSLRTPQ